MGRYGRGGRSGAPQLGSIEDEDGAFGQLSTSKVQDPDPAGRGKVQDLDPAGSETMHMGDRQILIAGDLRGDKEGLRGDAEDAGTITTAARLDLAGAHGLPSHLL